MAIKRLLMFTIALVLLLGCFLSACAPAAKPSPSVAPTSSPTTPAGPVNLSMAGAPSTSGNYMFAVALAKVLNTNVPGVNMTVLETGGAEEAAWGMGQGKYDMVHNLDPSSARLLFEGTGPAKLPAFPVRLLWLRSVTWKPLVVRKDSGVTTFAQLAGKKFNPGGAGSVAARTFIDSVEATGVKVDLYDATLEDAKKAIQDKKIVGMCKSSAYNQMDKTFVEISLTIPLLHIGYSKAEADVIMQKFPEYAGQYVYKAKGFLKDYPDGGDYYVEEHGTAAMGSTKISEENVYQMVKAVVANWKEIGTAFSASKDVDPIKDLIVQFKQLPIPLHAGVVKYCKEAGIDIPKNLIPPEYK